MASRPAARPPRAASTSAASAHWVPQYAGKRLELASLTDAEREFASAEMRVLASATPGADMPDWFQGRHFKKGQAVTFKYRELTSDGIPKEARYWRRRDAE